MLRTWERIGSLNFQSQSMAVFVLRIVCRSSKILNRSGFQPGYAFAMKYLKEAGRPWQKDGFRLPLGCRSTPRSPRCTVRNLRFDRWASYLGFSAWLPHIPCSRIQVSRSIGRWVLSRMQTVLDRLTAIAVADSAQQRLGRDWGILSHQARLTLATADQKRAAILAGLGVGWMPEPYVRDDLLRGSLIALQVRPQRQATALRYAWSTRSPGNALAWWLSRLQTPRVRSKLLGAT
ncbi:MAG: hypothetical protein EBT56_11030 [Betaproteobacteria bacterium]|nr:hypothetical protein [Betaproteobacteria bacterium]